MPAILAGSPLVVVPEIEHGLAEMLDDIAAIEIDVFDKRAAVVAVKNYVLVLAGRPASFDDDAHGVGRANRRVRDVRRNEERLPFPHEMIDDPVAFPDPDFDVAFKLIKIFFGIDEMKIVPRIWPLDHHDEEVAAIVEIAITNRRLEEIAVGFDPIVDVDRRQHLGRSASADSR